MYLIAGLGNPGPVYKGSRHNIGYEIINLISRQSGIDLDGRKFQSINGQLKIHDHECVLLCPITFMNLSGKSIKDCADYYNIDIDNILIIHDDLDLSVGKIKVKRKGGSGGHRGIQSVIDYLGAKEFARIKIGIGRPRYGETIEEYVLDPFYYSEKDVIFEVKKIAVQACRLFVSVGVDATMNQINNFNSRVKEVRI